ncbi:MAG TPA: hypothetical protein VIF62_29630 [Labilithrix sp.]
MALVGNIALVFVFFFFADLVYTLDHYFVHHDRERYRRGHSRHHRRYNGVKDDVQLDHYEITTYSSASLVSIAGMAAIALLFGAWGLLVGAVLKWIHSLVFHCYQHKWWGEVPIRQQGKTTPKRGWGVASAHYHSYHHAFPDDGVFTYAESWKGFDRILEWAHPWLVRFTKDGAPKPRGAQKAES